jgi:hypothetical protein
MDQNVRLGDVMGADWLVPLASIQDSLATLGILQLLEEAAVGVACAHVQQVLHCAVACWSSATTAWVINILFSTMTMRWTLRRHMDLHCHGEVLTMCRRSAHTQQLTSGPAF